MCGRFALYSDPKVLRERFDLVAMAEYRPSYNIAPTQPIAAITAREDGRHLDMYRWGLVPFWSKEIGSYSTFNAKAETVDTKPAFRGPFRYRRCLVPADGYYEWQKVGKSKQPWFIHSADGQPLAFAGLYDIWQEELRSATIIVIDAGEKTKSIHDRMPVILPSEAWDVWLAPDTPKKELRGLLKADDTVEMCPVSSRVNKAENDDAGCIVDIRNKS
jgi:putative SOS response-associated peptidase YedK